MERVHTLFKEKKITEVMQILQKRAASPDFGSLSQDIQADYYYNLACGASRLGRPRDAIAYLGVAVGYESGKGEKTYVELDSVIIPLKKAQRGISYTHDPAVFWARP